MLYHISRHASSFYDIYSVNEFIYSHAQIFIAFCDYLSEKLFNWSRICLWRQNKKTFNKSPEKLYIQYATIKPKDDKELQ